MKIDLSTLKNPREHTRTIAIVENKKGEQFTLCGTSKVVSNEIIRLVHGHNWKIIQYPTKYKGILDADGYFYPYLNQEGKKEG